MGRKRGNSSSRVPPRASGDLVTNLLVLAGILASLTFIAGSALLNYRMGYGSAGNDTDGRIYGSLAAAGDGLKALSPFVAAWGWRHRDWLATSAATIVFMVFTLYSFTSALGFSSQHRAHKEGSAAAEIERHQDTRDTIRRDRLRLDALGPQRSNAEVKQAIATLLGAPAGSGRWTVDQLSEGCTKNKALTRDICMKVATLKEEATRAEEAERLTVELRRFTNTTGTPLIDSADPQTDALTFLGRVLHLLPRSDKVAKEEGQQVGYGLAVLMAVFIELGSGLGLYIATTPWRSSRRRQDATEAPPPPLPAMTGGPPLEAFTAERLQRKPGRELHLATAFEAYKEWCEDRNRPMVGRTRFDRGLLKLARELGLEVDSGRSGWTVRDVALRPAARTTARLPRPRDG